MMLWNVSNFTSNNTRTEMTYRIAREIRILHEQDDWDYVFKTDEYGTVSVTYTEGFNAMTGNTTTIDIPKDCIEHFIAILEELK
jgi:hypothetical protein